MLFQWRDVLAAISPRHPKHGLPKSRTSVLPSHTGLESGFDDGAAGGTAGVAKGGAGTGGDAAADRTGGFFAGTVMEGGSSGTKAEASEDAGEAGVEGAPKASKYRVTAAMAWSLMWCWDARATTCSGWDDGSV